MAKEFSADLKVRVRFMPFQLYPQLPSGTSNRGMPKDDIFRELLKELTGMGKTILISSHILTELSELCNRIGIIEGGKLVFEGARAELNERLESHTSVVVHPVPEDFEKALNLLQDASFTESTVSEPYGPTVFWVVPRELKPPDLKPVE